MRSMTGNGSSQMLQIVSVFQRLSPDVSFSLCALIYWGGELRMIVGITKFHSEILNWGVWDKKEFYPSQKRLCHKMVQKSAVSILSSLLDHDSYFTRGFVLVSFHPGMMPFLIYVFKRKREVIWFWVQGRYYYS